MSRVLVTGGSGWIGGAVCAELERRGDVAVPFDLSVNPDYDVRGLAVHDVAGTVDAVIHLAGILGTAETIGAERRAADVNILGTVNVLDATAAWNLPTVIIGTGHKGQPNPYAITKGCAEELALARHRWRGDRVSVVRAYHVYGPGQKMCAPHGRSPVRKIVPSFTCRALDGMPVEVYGSGRQQIDMVYIDDVASVLVDAVDGPYGTVVEAGTGKPTTVAQVARDIIKTAGSASEIVYLPMRPGEPEDTVVVAESPSCFNAWPWRLDETVGWYRDKLDGRL